MRESVGEALRHPLSYTIGTVTSVFAFLHPSYVDAVFAALWIESGSIFTFASLIGFSLGPRLEWLPEQTWTYVAIGAGLLLALKRGLSLYRSFKSELESRL